MGASTGLKKHSVRPWSIMNMRREIFGGRNRYLELSLTGCAGGLASARRQATARSIGSFCFRFETAPGISKTPSRSTVRRDLTYFCLRNLFQSIINSKPNETTSFAPSTMRYRVTAREGLAKPAIEPQKGLNKKRVLLVPPRPAKADGVLEPSPIRAKK
jgi:hypothetical protein